ncbi:MAG: hypothetical protein AB8B95_08950 [Pseudohongiellaceae bacterium]
MRQNSAISRLHSAFQQGEYPLFFLVCGLACFGLLSLVSWITFSEDDAHVMRVALESGWLSPYYDGQTYKQLSAANFTPVVLTLFRLILNLFPFSEFSFLFICLGLMAVAISLSGLLVLKISQSTAAAWLAMLLVFSNFAVATMASRFYTLHYTAGGILALLSLLLCLTPNFTPRRCLAILMTASFAILAKEVYVVIPPLIFLGAWHYKSAGLAVAAAGTFVIYFTLRILVLGLPSGGGESSYLQSILLADSFSWAGNFFTWYFKSKWLIVVVAILALFCAPQKMIRLLPVPLLFLLPTFLASHAYLNPQLHGDRVFFAFDSALAIVAAVALAPLLKALTLSVVKAYVAAFTLLAAVFFSHSMSAREYRRAELGTTDYKVTKYLTDSGEKVVDQVYYVPLGFEQGQLAIVRRLLGLGTYLVTQNCILALEQPADLLTVFDQAGNISSRSALEAGCMTVESPVTPLLLPRAVKGLVEWDLQVDSGFIGGVIFVDRAIAVPAPRFSTVMVSPPTGEPYQLFAFKGSQWWFSEIMQMEIQR